MAWQINKENIFIRKKDEQEKYYDDFGSGPYRIIGTSSYLSLGEHKLADCHSNLDEKTKLVVGILDNASVAYIGKELSLGNTTWFRKYNFEGNQHQSISTTNNWIFGEQLKALNASPFLDDTVESLLDELKSIFPNASKSIDICSSKLLSSVPFYEQ